MKGALDSSMRVVGWFIAMQPKTGTPAGCRGMFTPIQFASADEPVHRHEAFKEAITAICRCQNYKCLRYNEFHESIVNLRSFHRHRFVERLAFVATLPELNRARQLAR